MIDFIFHLSVSVVALCALALLVDIVCFYNRYRWRYNQKFWSRVSAISLVVLLVASMINLGCVVYLVFSA